MIKYVPDKTGKFIQRPHYESKDLDFECEKKVVDFLKESRGKVTFPIQTDDLTKFVEKYASDLDQYADLSGYGENVQGVTLFMPKGKPKVLIASSLNENEWAENRLRTTMTHELGHVIFHAYLYQFELAGTSTDYLQICKRDDILAKNTYPGLNWMKWQAGYACGSFLMPVTYVKKVISDIALTPQKGVTPVELANVMVSRIVEEFQVSEEAARVRLSVLGLIVK